MKRWPVVGLLSRAIMWGIAVLVSIIAAAVLAGIITVPVLLISKDHNDLFALAISITVGSIVWPGLLTFSLMMIDRGLMVGPSRSLLKRAALWSVLPTLFVALATLLGIGPCGWWRGDPSDALHSKGCGWLFYVLPAVLFAIIGGWGIKPPEKAHEK